MKSRLKATVLDAGADPINSTDPQGLWEISLNASAFAIVGVSVGVSVGSGGFGVSTGAGVGIGGGVALLGNTQSTGPHTGYDFKGQGCFWACVAAAGSPGGDVNWSGGVGTPQASARFRAKYAWDWQGNLR